MSQEINYQQQYTTIKEQYDNLLQKNQNDVIRIKQKEKQLLDEIQRLKRQKEEQKIQYQIVIKALRRQIEEKDTKNEKPAQLTVEFNPHKHLQQKVQELQINVRKLMDQNILLTAQKNSINQDLRQMIDKIDNLATQNLKLKEFIQSLEKDISGLRQKQMIAQSIPTNDYSSQSQEVWISKEEFNQLQQKLIKSKKQYESLKHITSEVKQRIKKSEDQTRYIMDREKKATNLLKKKETQLIGLQDELEKLKMSTKIRRKKTQNEETCMKCNDYRRQIDLLKGMVKSTQGMVRVREIQVQKYKLHTNTNQQKQSRNNSRFIQKSPSLPPLKTIKEKK